MGGIQKLSGLQRCWGSWSLGYVREVQKLLCGGGGVQKLLGVLKLLGGSRSCQGFRAVGVQKLSGGLEATGWGASRSCQGFRSCRWGKKHLEFQSCQGPEPVGGLGYIGEVQKLLRFQSHWDPEAVRGSRSCWGPGAVGLSQRPNSLPAPQSLRY